MIDLKRFREQPEFFAQKSRDKGVTVDVAAIIDLDQQKRHFQSALETIQADKNAFSQKIASFSATEKEKLLADLKVKDGEADQLRQKMQHIEKELNDQLLSIPNPAADDVKVGKDGSENELLRQVGDIDRSQRKVSYLQITDKWNLLDLERARKVSGTRFAYLKNELVLMEFALVRLAFDRLSAQGFELVVPPVLIKEEAMQAMGYLARGGEDETYHFQKDGLYLVGTSEQSIGPMHMNEILSEKELPLRYTAFSPCFRREAGSHGKDTKGILRVHQFDKVEMFSFVKPEDSDQEHEFLLGLEEGLMRELGLPYQVIKMCSGDLGDPAARKYDIEAWIPSEGKYRETHSTSNCTDFQARRLNTRFHRAGSKTKTEFVHTLNGTAFAIGRTLIAIIEHYQQDDGSVLVPEVLQSFMGGMIKIAGDK